MAPAKRKHKSISISEKLQALERIDKGEKLANIASEFGVGLSTVKDWKKNRKEFISYCAKSVDQISRKRLKKPLLESLDEALWIWFCQEIARGTLISGPLIKSKAMSLHQRMIANKETESQFQASDGWLHSWKNRHGIRQISICEEELSADKTSVTTFIDVFSNFLQYEELTSDQIYNMAETGLNYKMLPSKTLTSKHENKVDSYNLAKERITVGVCSNASGNHKLPLIVIGKFCKSRAFKRLNLATLPVYYQSQKLARMDQHLFQEWFQDFFVPEVLKYLRGKNLPPKAILLIDNTPSHPQDLNHNGISTTFFPTNVTSLIQPMDQGVIACLKNQYRSKFMGTIIEKTAIGLSLVESVKSLRIKDVIYMVATAWDELPLTTLKKSWWKLCPNIEADTELEDDHSLAHLKSDWEQLHKILLTGIPEENELQEWVNGDEPANLPLTDEDLVKIRKEDGKLEQKATEDSDADNLESSTSEMISHSEAVDLLEKTLTYVEKQPSTTPADIIFFKRWRDQAFRQKMLYEKQTSFSPQ